MKPKNSYFHAVRTLFAVVLAVTCLNGQTHASIFSHVLGNVVKTVVKAGKDTTNATAKAGKDTEKAVAKAADDTVREIERNPEAAAAVAAVSMVSVSAITGMPIFVVFGSN